MSDDYLWDKSGKPDPEVQRLEQVLGELRHEGEPPPFRAPAVRPTRRPWIPALAAAAGMLIVAGAWWGVRLVQPPKSRWVVVALEGSPRVGAASLVERGTIAVGQWLVTDSTSRARIRVGAIGEVDVDPNTRIRLVRAQADEHRLALQRGTVHAAVLARPRLFFIETPAGVAVDLGCAYTLHVDETGVGELVVTAGWVAYERGGRESVIPRGAMCVTRPRVGPGTPFFGDALPGFKAALARLDFERLSEADLTMVLTTVVAQARPRDALTLWHLLTRVPVPDRDLVYDALAALVPPPAGVTREKAVAGDRATLDLWWDQLGFGDSQSWRKWKAKGPG